GEIDLGMASYLLGWKAGPNELLATLGVDGIIVARGLSLVPKPASEWKLVFENNEGRIYNRVGKALARVRAIDLPNEKSGSATVRLLKDSRQEVRADVAVPADGAPAAILFSRPFFDGYAATLNDKKIAVESYHGLAPLVRLPPGAQGRLTMTYRPWWLIWGGAIAIVSLAIFLIGCGCAIFRARAQ
ncbi:MAG TPA: hypothetical protein VHW03_05650, partial [Chthoniobacterales bacterium]|nr:hypothetical protein [Chthoniobacterales bacterium]